MNNFAIKGDGKYTITRTKTCFPSELEIKEGVIHMHGGLILLELSPQPHLKKFTATITVTAKDIHHKQQTETFNVAYDLPEGEQFFT